MAKMLKFDEMALNAILKGVKTLAKAVIVTLGPRGRNVVINKDFGSPLSTKDGVTVAKEVAMKDKFENMGAQLVKEAAMKTSDVAGDGTTTAIVLAETIYAEGVKNVIAGSNPMDVKKGIDKSVKVMVEALDKLASKIKTSEEINQIASISANNDKEIGIIIAEAMKKVGNDGIVTIAEARGIETDLDVVEGMQFDKGYISPYFVTDAEKMTVELDNARILITDKKISSAKEIVPILEAVAKEGKPLLIVADDVDAEALATLVVNKIKAGLSVCAVKAPGFGDNRKEMLKDAAVLTGATFISEEVGLTIEDVNLKLLGFAKKIKVSKEDTIIIEGQGKEADVKKRAAQIKAQIEKTESNYEREKLEERLAKMVGGIARINVGAVTEADMKEKKARVEDALHATRAAIAGGIVPGGGVALIRASKALDKLDLSKDEAIGREIVRKAAFAPAIAIANNCGKQGNVIAEKIYEKEGSFGYNGLTDEFTDLIKAGVVDPVLVTKNALMNASSVAGMLITIAAMITDKPKPKEKTCPHPHGDMGHMGGMPGMMPGMDEM